MEGAIYKVNPLLREDDSDCVDKADQDINQEDHSKMLKHIRKLLLCLLFSAFSREKMRFEDKLLMLTKSDRTYLLPRF